MLIQAKPNRWSCIATAFSVVLEIPAAKFFDTLGHDGSQIVHPELPDPISRRGIHIQECIYVAMQHGRSVTPVELLPRIQTHRGEIIPVHYHNSVSSNWERFETLIHTTHGVVTGHARIAHAMAYGLGTVVDPDTACPFAYAREACEKRGFHAQCLWIVT